MLTQKVDQPVRRRQIGAHGMLGTAAVAGEMIGPIERDGARGVVN
jgi:hypothetical protein